MVKFDGTLATGLVIGIGFVTTGGAVAGFGIAAGQAPRHAEVVDVQPVTRTLRVPREVCVQLSGAQRDAARRAGDAATVSRQRCRTVDAEVARVVGYDVTYRLDDRVEVVRLPQAPGTRVLVKAGRVVLEPATPGAASGGAPASG